MFELSASFIGKKRNEKKVKQKNKKQMGFQSGWFTLRATALHVFCMAP